MRMHVPWFVGKVVGALVVTALVLWTPVQARAGSIFLTGHDPDFHAQDSAGAKDLLRSGLNFVTGGTYNDLNPLTPKFLWVESFNAPTSGHRVGELGLVSIGLTLGVQFDWVDAALLSTVNLNDYSAIGIASSFGGMLTTAELNELIARKDDIKNFINSGGGLFASAECFPASSTCFADTLAGSSTAALYSYLPVTVSSVDPTLPFHVTAAGAAAPFNLTDGDVNDPTHNSFGLIGGLTALDLDSGNPQQATTLAGNVTVGGGGFTPVPTPASLLLLGAGFSGLAGVRRWIRRCSAS
ncbi:MAG TPA: VPLPA-CTERM sorting domain-containing protein [Gaiellales bacterium]|nr:VPLPA-CTERM sorting domain-containing protein [Gaiellales bacterium]